MFLKKAVKYSLHNYFFQLGNKIFRQIIGIPMGSDTARFFASFILYYYESKGIKNIKKDGREDLQINSGLLMI